MAQMLKKEKKKSTIIHNENKSVKETGLNTGLCVLNTKLSHLQKQKIHKIGLSSQYNRSQ